MWKNKHLVVALLVAPVLSIIAWFAVDRLVGEQPHAARQGAAYELIGKPNCRYESGVCDLVNGEFKVTLRAESEPGALSLTSSHPITHAVAARGNASDYASERSFTRATLDSDLWRVTFAPEASASDRLRLAISADGTTYFAEIGLNFATTQNPSD